MIRGKKVLVAGASGRIGAAVAMALATENEVWGLARFRDRDVRRRVTGAGVRCVPVDLSVAGPDELADRVPAVDYGLNFAVQMRPEPDFDRDFTCNAEPLALLMAHCRTSGGFLHCSSTAVYEPAPTPRKEGDPLGDYMRASHPTYSISKIASEAVARSCARQLALPTTIARLNVPYSDTGGWLMMHLRGILAGEPIPVHPHPPDVFAPLHEYDLVRTVPALLAAAAVPATVVNWGGDEPVGVGEWTRFMGELVDREVHYLPTEAAIRGMNPDTTRLRSLIGGPASTIGWRDGVRRMVQASR